MNPMDFIQIKPLLDSFKANHPKFLQFISAISGVGLQEGTIVEITVTAPEGQSYDANLKLTADDIEMIRKLRQMM